MVYCGGVAIALKEQLSFKWAFIANLEVMVPHLAAFLKYSLASQW